MDDFVLSFKLVLLTNFSNRCLFHGHFPFVVEINQWCGANFVEEHSVCVGQQYGVARGRLLPVLQGQTKAGQNLPRLGVLEKS